MSRGVPITFSKPQFTTTTNATNGANRSGDESPSVALAGKFGRRIARLEGKEAVHDRPRTVHVGHTNQHLRLFSQPLGFRFNIHFLERTPQAPDFARIVERRDGDQAVGRKSSGQRSGFGAIGIVFMHRVEHGADTIGAARWPAAFDGLGSEEGHRRFFIGGYGGHRCTLVLPVALDQIGIEPDVKPGQPGPAELRSSRSRHSASFIRHSSMSVWRPAMPPTSPPVQN